MSRNLKKGVSLVDIRDLGRALSNGNCVCKGPEVRVSLECSGNNLEAGGLECREGGGNQRGSQEHSLLNCGKD